MKHATSRDCSFAGPAWACNRAPPIQAQLNRNTDAVVEVWLDVMAADSVSVEEFAVALRSYEATGPKFWGSALELRAHVPRLAVVKIDN